jgi:hypothetical protein
MYWAYPTAQSPDYLGFKLYRNPDGHGKGFGDLGIGATSSNDLRVSAYSAIDSSSGDITVMLINKLPKATVTLPLTLQGAFHAGSYRMWRLAADNPGAIVALPQHNADGNKIVLTLPPYSATLMRITPEGHAN